MKARMILPVIWTLTGALIVKLLISWNDLPQRIAVHFDIRMQPNGWSSKSDLVMIVLFAAVGEAMLATFVLLRLGAVAGAAGVALLMVNVIVVSAFWQVINYNTQGTPFRPLWIVLSLLAAFSGLAVLFAVQTLAYQKR